MGFSVDHGTLRQGIICMPGVKGVNAPVDWSPVSGVLWACRAPGQPKQGKS